MAASVGWRKTGPVLAAAILIVGLGAVTVWIRKPANVQSADVLPVKTIGGEAGDGVSGDIVHAGGLHPNTDAPMNASEMQQQVKQSIERRARLRDQLVRESAAAKQKAVATFSSERVDPTWASGKEAELTGIARSSAIAEAKAAPKTFDIDCKSTMCLLNGSFATNGEAEDWTLLYMSSVGSALPNSVVSRTQNPDGTTSVEIYGKAR